MCVQHRNSSALRQTPSAKCLLYLFGLCLADLVANIDVTIVTVITTVVIIIIIKFVTATLRTLHRKVIFSPEILYLSSYFILDFSACLW